MSAATFPLSLRPAPAAVHAPAGWFIPGNDPARWLAEIARWGLPMPALRLYVLPASVRDRSAIGVLVVPPDGAAPQSVRRALPYGRLAGRLFLPVDARLDPPVSDAELRDKLLLDVQVLHPSAGLVGFQEDEALAVHDLIAPPPWRETDWGRAVAAEAPKWRLVTVEPEEVPDVGDILDLGRGDIGSEAPDDLPPAPDESKLKDLKDAAARAGRPGLKIIKWLASHAPAGASGPTWANQLGEWANRKLSQISSGLEAARLKELHRLQNLLNTNPDEGLRHAIPLRSLGTRGRAPPGSRLTPHNVNFSLGGLGGGGRAADTWDVPPDVLQALRQRYREAANRELRLGRYRRAAYIFAELLGDFAAAASALEQGRHYREAAVLYRDHLKQPRKAAECLEHGGLLTEAVALYEELQMFEKAGDLYAQLEQPDEAARCYRAQVSALLARAHTLAAAQLLETKLRAPDEALTALTAAWPDSDAAGVCLRAAFQLLGRLVRHDDATRRLAEFRRDPAPPGRAATLTQVLADVATSYPEQTVRTLGADAARVTAGRHLADAHAGTGDRELAARAVARLAPEDRLLARDAERFLAKPRPRPSLPKPTTRAAYDPVVVRQFHLPETVEWRAAAADGEGFYALGTVSKGLAILRGLWDGRTQMKFAKLTEPVPDEPRWALQPVPGQSRVTFTPVVRVDMPYPFPATNVFPTRAEAGSPAWLVAQGPLAIGHSEDGVTWVLRWPADAQVVLQSHRSDTGYLLGSHLLGHDTLPDSWPQIVARAGHVFVTWGQAVLRPKPNTGLVPDPMPRPVRRLAISSPHTRLRVAVGLEEGGMLLWPDGPNTPFGDGLTDPLVAFTRGGTLVAADAREGRVYRTDGGAPHRRGDFAGLGANPVALTPTNRLNEFAAFAADGKVTVYQVPV